MFMEEAAETELDESEGMASGAESEKALDLAEGPEWVAASSLRHLSTDLEPLHLPLATSAPNVPLECTPAKLGSSSSNDNTAGQHERKQASVVSGDVCCEWPRDCRSTFCRTGHTLAL